jgi:protein arginine kinase
MTTGPFYEPPQTPSGGNPPPLDTTTEWLRGEGEASDVVLSSRVRLARNLAGAPFAAKSSRRDRLATLEACRNQVLRAGLAERLVWIDLHEAPMMQRSLFVERHLISKQHSKGRPMGAGAGEDPRAVAFSVPDERLSIMVNEEDHLRIQAIRSGLALAAAWREIDEVDDKLESGLDYAFSPRFGYLTACPTNVGTGLRMSAMLHLPGLRLTGDIEKVKRAAQDMSLAVRGFYGEGSEAVGDLYQLSNQTTLGKSEATILHELESEIIPRVIEYERVSRRELLTKRRVVIEDQVCRAWGLLTNARLLTTDEAMQALSLVRLGTLLGLLKNTDQKVVNQMMLVVQPSHLQRAVGKELDQEQRRVARASLLRSRLTKPA